MPADTPPPSRDSPRSLRANRPHNLIAPVHARSAWYSRPSDEPPILKPNRKPNRKPNPKPDRPSSLPRRDRPLRPVRRRLRARDAYFRGAQAAGRVPENRAGSGVPSGAAIALARVCRPPDAALLCGAAHCAPRPGGWIRPADLSEAGGFAAHRSAQDQQRHRTGVAGAAHGQEAHHRRDRRRTARRGHGHRMRPLWFAVCGVHGRQGYGAAKAERVPHAPAGCRGATGAQRYRHPQGRVVGGDPRLGHLPAKDALRCGQRGWAAPVSSDGARLSGRHRRRGAPAGAGAARAEPPAGYPPGVRGRRQQRHGPLPSFRGRAVGADDRSRGRRRRSAHQEARGHAHQGHLRRAARRHVVRAARRVGPDPRAALHQCRIGLPRVGPEHAYMRDTRRAEYWAVTDNQAVAAFLRVSKLEGIIRRWRPATRSPP
eukprot:ctg_1766.g542